MSEEQAVAIERFWAFWVENQEAIARSIPAGLLREWVEPISARVRAISPELDWEFGKGHAAQHYFCVSAKGDMSLRLVAERWRAAGPPADEVFEYHAARPGGGYQESAALDFGEGLVFGVSDFRFGLQPDTTRLRVHVEVWHPSFVQAPAQVPEQLRLTATFIALDAVLGEDDVERWIGAVELREEAPAEGELVGFPGLLAAVDELRDAEDGYSLLQGVMDDAPILVTARLGVKRVDHVLMDVHLELAIAIAEPTAEGFPTSDEADRLNAAEDDLVATLGPDAVVIGRETTRGVRRLHYHVALGGPALARVDAWMRQQPWEIEVRSHLDPEWDVLSRW